MERRLLLAVILMTVTIAVTNIFFPPAEAPEPAAESTASVSAPPASQAAPAAPSAQVTAPLPVAAVSTRPDTVWVTSSRYRYGFSTMGARVVRAELLEFQSYVADGAPVQLVPPEIDRFLSYSLEVGGDTVDLSTINFQPSAPSLEVSDEVTALDFSYSDPAGFGVTIRYEFDPDVYLIHATGRLAGVSADNARLLVQLGPRLEVHEDRGHQSEREFAVVSRANGSSARRLASRSVEGTEALEPDLTWIGIKDKYFLAAVISDEDTPFANGVVRAEQPEVRVLDGDEVELPQVQVTADLPVSGDGTFDFDLYLGPQEFFRLAAIGYDLEDVTPYGYRWLQPVIRPFAAGVLWILAALHDTLGIAYGWVLVLFGVMMRVVLWPLNAKAMRAQMKNMAVQPLMQEIKEKYKSDPQKQQEAMIGLYKEHGFNPLAGCLPMLVPFPVLITLFFVFQNTVAFRGEQFLWLPDLSLRDPLYILPFVLVTSMFALQWVSAHLSGMEQNPQMKMMMYFMPVMMGAIFFMLPAGLNLYYAVQQLASIPQQVLIARERREAQEELKKTGGPKLSVPKGGKRTRKAKS